MIVHRDKTALVRLNFGCIPSKALLSSAEMLHGIQNARQWGITVNGEIGFDWQEITQHKNKILRQLRGGIANLFKGRGVTQLTGHASFDGAGRVVVTPSDGPPRVVTAGKVIIATGSVPIRIPGWPTDPEAVCTSDQAVHWTTLPRKLLIVGGGVIGCEFACMMQAFGVEVTVVEMLPRLLPTLDHDLGKALLAIFKGRGITCYLDTKVESLDVASAGDSIKTRMSGGRSSEFDRVLVATGRRPNTDKLELNSAGIQAGTAELALFDDSRPRAHLRRLQRGNVSAGAGSDDEDVEVVSGHWSVVSGQWSVNLSLTQLFAGVLQNLFQTPEELGGKEAIDEPVVGAECHRHHTARTHRAVFDNHRFPHGTHREDS
jgi:dihydrolipoamide dehydrogenase